jgi:hypothetical protein
MCVLVTGRELTDEDFKIVYNNSNVEFNSKITATICFPKYLNIRNNKNNNYSIEYINRPLMEFMRQAQELLYYEYLNKMQEAIDKDRADNYTYSTEQIIFNKIDNISFNNQVLLLKNKIEEIIKNYCLSLILTEITFTEYNNKIILVFVLKYKPSQESAKNIQDILNIIKEIKL